MNQDFNAFLKKYFTARIDIKNYGNDKNNIFILDNADSDSEVSQPNWFKNDLGVGTVIESCEGNLDLKIKCIHNGELKIYLRGIDARDKNHNRFPVYIDYTNFLVNDEPCFEGSKLVWHDYPYIFSKNVNDSEIIDIHIEWLPFNPSSEFKVDESPDLVQSLRGQLAIREKQLKSIPQLCYTTLGYTVLDGRLTYRNLVGVHENTVMDDFNGFCDNVWFTRFLKHKFPDEDFKINFFGVFNPHNNLTYPMEGKKVLYSIEELNNRFLEMKLKFDKYALDYVDLAMSYEIYDHPKYLRFPYWVYRHISPESTEEDVEKKVEYWNSVSFEKSKDVSVIASHDRGETRTLVANDISKFVDIEYAGRWKNNTSEMFTKYHNNKLEYIKQFKFNICSENIDYDAYVTEKIFDAFHSDCIPLFLGAGNYLEPEVINPNTIIRWYGDKQWGCNPNLLKNVHYGYYTEYPLKWVANDDRNSDSIELFKNLLTDKKTYDEFKDQDKVLPSSTKFIMKILNDLEKHFERLIYS